MPAIIIKNRICPKCGENKWYKQKRKSKRKGIYKIKEKDLFHFRCVKCVLDYQKSDKHKKTVKIWFDNNRKRINQQRKEQRQTPKGKLLVAKAKQRYRTVIKKELRKSYIIKLLSEDFRRKNVKFDVSKISDKDINAYKEILIIKRELKNETKKKIKTN